MGPSSSLVPADQDVSVSPDDQAARSSDTLNREPEAEPYFAGSSNPEDYIINLSLPPDRQPIDVQAYLECIGMVLKCQEFPDDPKWNGSTLLKETEPYTPRLELVAAGLRELIRASDSKECGLWMEAADISPEDMERFPHYPWMASLIRTKRFPQLGLDIRDFYWTKDSWNVSRFNVIYTNVRIAFPDRLDGPQESCFWLYGTFAVYGKSHPVIDMAEAWSAVSENLTELDIVVDIRSTVSDHGVRHNESGVYPCNEFQQSSFDRDPEAYDEEMRKRQMRGQPVPENPVGFDEWWDMKEKDPVGWPKKWRKKKRAEGVVFRYAISDDEDEDEDDEDDEADAEDGDGGAPATEGDE